jgi:hypothetical protein
MALFYEARLFISDENGVAINGGKARFRDANTLNLTSLYSDATLSTPLTNPVVADGNGWTPQIFAAEGTLCDLQYLTAGDVEIPSRNYVDVVALGSDTGASTRTFSGGTRYKLSDSGGVVLAEAGDPSPDNVGGSMTDQGWAGTQGDTRTFNYAHVNAGTSAGALKENSKKLTGVIQTDATAFSGSAGIVIPLTSSPTGVRAWEIEIWDLQCAGVTALTCQLSYDSGATYKAGAADYLHTKWITDNTAGPGTIVSVSAGDTKLDIGYAMRTAANRSSRLTLKILTPDSGSEHTLIESDGVTFDRTAATSMAKFGGVGAGVGNYGRATHIKILQGANLISGSYRIITRRGSGET